MTTAVANEIETEIDLPPAVGWAKKPTGPRPETEPLIRAMQRWCEKHKDFVAACYVDDEVLQLKFIVLERNLRPHTLDFHDPMDAFYRVAWARGYPIYFEYHWVKHFRPEERPRADHIFRIFAG